MPIHFMLAPYTQSGVTIREQFSQLDAIWSMKDTTHA